MEKCDNETMEQWNHRCRRRHRHRTDPATDAVDLPRGGVARGRTRPVTAQPRGGREGLRPLGPRAVHPELAEGVVGSVGLGDVGHHVDPRPVEPRVVAVHPLPVVCAG